ncbi:hypothetical protein [Rhizobacter sp. Root404]|uniref:hypothetical protein n=1 Tax=Rhizobacter sp. Root404 TaxID=1736528 RepID=UPI0006F90551|nr:hypothetical protein [Rhizobacter sp. Root404]KQW36515.1 hypothetical protein ASC76_17775 [Rhizobacter sp. Root404]
MGDAEARIQACQSALEAHCVERRLVLSGDLRVSEEDAAKLLGIAHGHLKNMRQEGKGPASYARGMNGCRLSYRLLDLALWIEAGRQDW